ncbi:MAG: trypsin-like peptidase domain-containing protein [Fimbriimonadaceae bacterium]|nr:trypsin-like peptidase domain-containing protein [Fimbriimonadaceae bacterium]
MQTKRLLLTVVLTAVSAFVGVLAAVKLLPGNPVLGEAQPAKRAAGVLLPAANGTTADFRGAVKAILPSVVSIDTIEEGTNFFNERIRRKAQSGSGVVTTEDGYIVTNAHVVLLETFGGEKRPADGVNVTLSDGRVVSAKIVGVDTRSDLAVLKVAAKNLVPIAMGDSSGLEVGQWVVAVGNPLGYENTVSVGVVSSINRPLPMGDQAVFIDGIQTDAAINMGNSGGALCDADGRLVGINTAIASIGGGNIGLAFAIPVKRMRTVMEDIIKVGRPVYGTLGVRVYQPYSIIRDPRRREQLKELTHSPTEPPENGIILDEIDPAGGAAKAGLAPLDVVTEMDGKPINSIEDFLIVLSPKRPGDTVELTVWSKGKVKKVAAKLEDASQ